MFPSPPAGLPLSCSGRILLRPRVPPEPAASPGPPLHPDFTAARTRGPKLRDPARWASPRKGGTEPRRRGGPDALLPGVATAQGSAPRVQAPLGRDCTGHWRVVGARGCRPGGSGSRSSALGVSRIAARAKLTGVGAARGARRGQEAIDPVLATVPFIRAAGRQSPGGGRQSKVPREPAGVGRRGRAGAAGRAAL